MQYACTTEVYTTAIYGKTYIVILAVLYVLFDFPSEIQNKNLFARKNYKSFFTVVV